jgi:hypothetical protein
MTIHQMNSILWAALGTTAHPLNWTAEPDYNGTYPLKGPETEFQASLHLSFSLACMVLMLFIMYHVRTAGYELSYAWLHSTDFIMWGAMLLTSIVWTVLVALSGSVTGGPMEVYCKLHLGWACLGRMAFIPWIQMLASTWWAILYLAVKCRPQKFQSKTPTYWDRERWLQRRHRD